MQVTREVLAAQGTREVPMVQGAKEVPVVQGIREAPAAQEISKDQPLWTFHGCLAHPHFSWEELG